jgi:hypothetical protein
MKKITLIVFASLTIILCNFMPAIAQSEYGSDIIVKNAPTENQRNPSLAIAKNGWLFAAFTADNGFCVYKSTDNGQSWALFTSFSTSGRIYDMVKIKVVGDSYYPFKVFIAALYHSSSTYYGLYVDVYDPTTNTFMAEPLNYTFATDLYDFDISTDFISGIPYGIGLLYSVHAATDSITFVLSDNGGVSFGPKKSVATTNQYFGKVSLGYGYSDNIGGGHFAVWEQKQGYLAHMGRIGYAHNTINNISFTTPVFLDNANNNFLNSCCNPKIACQQSAALNDSADITAVVLFERYYSHLDNDIVGLYNKRTYGGTTWNVIHVDNSGSTNCKQPDIEFDSYFYNCRFLVTYWDSTHNYLPFVTQGMNILTPNTWTVISPNYNDNTSMGSMLQPYPSVEINNTFHQVAHIWASKGTGTNGVVMFDAEYAGVGIKETVTYGTDKISNIYPNPAYRAANIEIELNKPALVEINIFDMSGKKVNNLYQAQTPVGKNTISIDVSNYTNGNYIIEMLTPELRTTKSLIVAHQ